MKRFYGSMQKCEVFLLLQLRKLTTSSVPKQQRNNITIDQNL